jgi:hypothetical protein
VKRATVSRTLLREEVEMVVSVIVLIGDVDFVEEVILGPGIRWVYSWSHSALEWCERLNTGISVLLLPNYDCAPGS